MADAGEMILRSLAAQQGEAPCVLEAQSRGSEDTSWHRPSEAELSPSDWGLTEHADFAMLGQVPAATVYGEEIVYG